MVLRLTPATFAISALVILLLFAIALYMVFCSADNSKSS